MPEDKAHALSVFTLQYRVLGSLDGVTPAPLFTEGTYTGENLLDFEVQNLGLIDMTLGRDVGQIADRIARWLYILSPTFTTQTVIAQVAFDGSPVQDAVTIPLGSAGVYTQQCVLVPQSGQLRLRGFAGLPGQPVVVRIEVWIPTDIATLAEMQRYCCCSFETLPPQPLACARQVLTFVPTPIVTGGPQAVPITITGTNFQAGDEVVIMNSLGETLNVGAVVVVNSTTITATLTLSGTETLGPYDVIVGPAGFPTCAGMLEDGLTLT